MNYLPKFIFYFLIFTFPFQINKVFFTNGSFFSTYHVFYHTFFFSLTDLLIYCLVLSWFLNFALRNGLINTFSTIGEKLYKDKFYRIIGVFSIFLLASVFVSREIPLALWGTVKFFQFFLLFAFIREEINVSYETLRIAILILTSFSVQAIISILQYLGQRSIGLKFLGESLIYPGISGVAGFVSRETVVPWVCKIFPFLQHISYPVVNIRPYGTFPHPNILGAGLFMAFILGLFLLYKYKDLHVSREKLLLALISGGLFLTFTGVVISFSRQIWLVALIAFISWLVIVWYFIRRGQVQAMKVGQYRSSMRGYFPERIAIIVGLVAVSFVINFYLFRQPIEDRLFGSPRISREGPYSEQGRDESVEDRTLYNRIAIEMIKARPFLGTGVRNFILRMDDFSREMLKPYQHQPVHNIYLLIAAEEGVPALVVFVLLLFYIVRHGARHRSRILKGTLLVIFAGFLALGLVDHYFVTSEQGAFMFWLIGGLLAAKNQ